MNSVRQNTTLCNGSLLKFNMKTKNPVGTLDVHYPRFASVLSCSLSRLKKRSFPLAQNSQNSVVHWIAYPDRILRFLYLPYESANSHHCTLYHINLIRDELYRILFPFIHCVNRTKLKLFQQKDRCKIFVVTAASSPTAWVCLTPLVLRVSSRERSEISDAADTENFSCPCWNSFSLFFINKKKI